MPWWITWKKLWRQYCPEERTWRWTARWENKLLIFFSLSFSFFYSFLSNLVFSVFFHVLLWFFICCLSVHGVAVGSVVGGAEGRMFSALAAAWEAAAALQLPGQTAAWRTAAPELLPSHLHHPHHQCQHHRHHTTPQDTTRSDTIQQVNQLNRQVNSPLMVMVAEGVAGAEGGGSDFLHIAPLQPQTGAASGNDGATDPRSEHPSPVVSGALNMSPMNTWPWVLRLRIFKIFLKSSQTVKGLTQSYVGGRRLRFCP